MRIKLDEIFGRRCAEVLVATVQTFVAALWNEAIEQKLWIVETGRIRVYRPEE